MNASIAWLLLCYFKLLVMISVSASDSFLSDEDLARGVELLDANQPSEPVTTGLENPDTFEGDIDLGQEVSDAPQDPTVLGNAIRNLGQRWPNGRVPYVLSSSFNGRQRGMIAAAFEDFRRRTCIRFVPRSNEAAYISVRKGSGCSSTVGRTGRMQTLSLAGNCFNHGVIIHEFMHAIGFWHEQSRTDRDQHVTIHWNNIHERHKHNFNKYGQDKIQHLGERYDYGSVMHYFRTIFSRNGRPTITPKRSGVRIGQQRGFSNVDVRKIHKLYKCGMTESKCKKQSGKDIDHGDISNKKGQEHECCGICAGTQNCKGYAWSDHDGGTCWLKETTGPIVNKAGVSIGIRPETGGSCVKKSGKDIKDGDISNKQGQEHECCGICASTRNCKAYAWSGHNGGTCWLKETTAPVIYKPGVSIGIRSAAAGERCQKQSGKDISENNIGNRRGKEYQCCGLCINMRNCRAYAWSDYKGGTCWFKNATGPIVPNLGVSIGIKT